MRGGEGREGRAGVYVCLCVSDDAAQSSHLLREKDGASGKAGPCNWRAWHGPQWRVVGCCHVVTVACQPAHARIYANRHTKQYPHLCRHLNF